MNLIRLSTFRDGANRSASGAGHPPSPPGIHPRVFSLTRPGAAAPQVNQIIKESHLRRRHSFAQRLVYRFECFIRTDVYQILWAYLLVGVGAVGIFLILLIVRALR